MNFLNKNWSNILFLVLIALLFIPQTAMPIKVFVNRLIAFSPSEIKEDARVTLKDYRWNLKTSNSTEINFTRSEGNVALVNLWATWCPPCVAEMPSLQKLYDKYGDRVDFYFVTSESPQKIKKFLQKKDYNFPVYLETQQPPKELRTRSLPTTFLISKKGNIVVKEKGAADWNSKKVHAILDELLQE